MGQTPRGPIFSFDSDSDPTQIASQIPATAAAMLSETAITTPPAPGSNPGLADGELGRGTQVDRYEVIRELGRGGMGRVYLARDLRLARLVALKFLGPQSAGLHDRFLVEARATARARHDNIVVIYAVDEWNGRPYMALEYLEGAPLSSLLDDLRPAPMRVVELMVQVARALVCAHTHGIVHCDLKPANVFVTRDGGVKVLDFGLAQLLAAGGTGESEFGGTMPYMSPEQWGMGEVDHRSDLYAVGVMMWELLAGRYPVEPPTQGELVAAAAALDQPLPSIATAVAGLPASLVAVVDECLVKPVAGRIPTATALLDALEAVLPRIGRRATKDECPYPGLAGFEEVDAGRFFGRDREVRQLVTALRDQPLVGVIAPSGAGKSSLINAGLVPALRTSDEPWEVLAIRPARGPLASLAAALEPMLAIDRRVIATRLRSEPGYFGAALRDHARGHRTRVLIHVDQLEELYTMCPDPDERHAFVACLAGAADDSASRLRVVVTMRSDFLDRAAEDRAFMARLAAGLMFLPPLGRDAIRAALVEPLTQVGYAFEDDHIVDDMIAGVVGEPGALPLLQFTAALLWDARDTGRRRITAASYAAIGGLAGALAAHADRVIAAMSAPARAAARAMLLRLVTVEGTRALVDVADLTTSGAVGAQVVDQLVAARLLVVHARDDGPVIELVHESLISRWPMLRRWREESSEEAVVLDQLRGAARQWDARGRPEGLLWRGDAFEDAQLFARRFTGELPPRERAFLDAVLALGHRAVRRRRRIMIAALVLLSSLVAASSIALVWIRDAEHTAQNERTKAEGELVRATTAEANARAVSAERVTALQKALDAERDRDAARVQATAAQDQATAAEGAVERSREDLKRANTELEQALAKARADQRKAELAEDRARTNETAAKNELERERAKREKLEKLTTKLK